MWKVFNIMSKNPTLTAWVIMNPAISGFLFYFFMQFLIIETGLQQIFNFTIKSIIIINLFIYFTNLKFKKNNY